MKKQSITIFVTESEKVVVSAALKRAEQITKSKSRGFNMECICLEFLRMVNGVPAREKKNG